MTHGDPVSSSMLTPPRASVPTSTRLGRYHLGCELASGGMATVFLAVPTDGSLLARPVALKRIHPHLAPETEFIEMFIDEARIASRLSHPNLCGVLDFGEVDGTYFMTMEYLVGEPLNRLQQALCTRAEPVAAPTLARVAAQIVADAAEGLHAAHEVRDDDGNPLHVVHRDVSPSNLFVAYDGPTRVVDFGIASAADRLHHTATGAVKGKFGYMSPEQMRAEKADRRADIWALGVVLWETITLRRLFRRENASLTVLATLEGHVPPLHEVVPGVDPALTSIVARALCREPEGRYPTARAMADDLHRFLASSGTPNARPEVAALVAMVFPEGESEKRRLVKAVLEQRKTLEPLAKSDTNPSQPALPSSGIVVKSQPPLPWHATVPPPRRPLRTGVALGFGAAIFAGAAAWLVHDRDDTPLPTASTPPPRPPIVRTPSSIPPPAPAVGAAVLAANDGTTHPAPAPAPVTLTSASAAPASRTQGEPTERVVPATPHATAARRVGVVSIFTNGDWAQVYLRGRSLGPTPGRFTLPEGRQVLTLRPGSGGPSRTVVVEVREGQTVHLRTEL